MRIFERLNIFRNLSKRVRNKCTLFFIAFTTVIITMSVMHILSGNKTSAMESDVSLDDTLTILLLGVDNEDSSLEGSKNTDSVFLVNYNPKAQNCQVISFPRDTLVPYKDSNMKLRYLYSTGGENLIKDTIENMMNIEINGLVTVDISGFRKIIDAIGGVDVSIERDMYYDNAEKNLSINFKAGETIHLDGEKAEEFFRWRNNNDEKNTYLDDTARIKNQKLLIDKVFEKVISFSGISNVNEIFKVIKSNVETDLSLDKIISYGLAFTRMDKENIIVTSLSGETKEVDGISYFIYDKGQIESLSNEYESLESLNAMAYKRTMKVKIINCTKIKGLAGDVKEKLEALGYTNISVEGTNEFDKTEIYFNDERYKEIILEDFGSYKIGGNMPSRFDENNEYDVVIALGKDYKKVGETK